MKTSITSSLVVSLAVGCITMMMHPTNAFLVPSSSTRTSTITKKSIKPTFVETLKMSSTEDDDQSEQVTTTEKKETTWDRITGPKLFKTVTNWNGIHSVPLVPLRIMTGLLMIHHGSEGGTFTPGNFGTPEFQGFVDYIIKPYFGFLPGPPELWSAIHDYIEFFGGIFFAFGFLTRPASLALMGTMASAVYFHLSSVGAQGFPLGHVPNYSYDFEEPMLYCLIFLMFWFNGAGPLSIDSIIYSNISQEDEE
mmetsp:Transcript_12596/g.17874  ORF Transcript_12596/g.17874 Transcript_12596/m.17874 type:complete len:251 (+) Transcript_12596:180-932(+)